MLDTQLEIFRLENELVMKEVGEADQIDKAGQERLEQQIIDEFQSDPEVIDLNQEIALAAEQRDTAKSGSRLPNDPSRCATELQYKRLMKEYDKLWKTKYDEILKSLRSKSPSASVVELRKRLVSAKARKVALAKLFDEAKMEDRRIRRRRIEPSTTISPGFPSLTIQHLTREPAFGSSEQKNTWNPLPRPALCVSAG